jgi:hypothetical protein
MCHPYGLATLFICTGIVVGLGVATVEWATSGRTRSNTLNIFLYAALTSHKLHSTSFSRCIAWPTRLADLICMFSMGAIFKVHTQLC